MKHTHMEATMVATIDIKLVPYEDGMAFIVDKETFEQLNISQDAKFQAVSDGHSLTITPVRDEARRAKIQSILEELDQEYGPVFKRLAE